MSVGGNIVEHMFDRGDDAPGAADSPGAANSPSLPSDCSTAPRQTVHQALAQLLEKAPSARVLVELASIDVASLCSDDAISYAQILDRIIGWCQALQGDALVVAAGREPRVETFRAGAQVVVLADLMQDEIAPALRWSGAFTDRRLSESRLMAGPLGDTRSAVIEGRISPAHARVICSVSERLPSFLDHSPEGRRTFWAQCSELQAKVLPVAQRGTVAQARRSAERAALRIDARSRREVQRRGLGVNLIDEGGGISTLIARMRTMHAHACLAAIDDRAADPMLEVAADCLIGERQALALASLVLPADHAADPASKDGAFASNLSRNAPADLIDIVHRGCVRPHLRAHLEVTVSLETLLGLSDEPASFRSSRGLEGVLDLWAVRELLSLSDATTLRRLVTDSVTGHLLDRGRASYRVPESLRAFLVSRDLTCRFPGCKRRAGLGEIDHVVPWNAGGRTDRANLGVLCKRHHLVKTFGGWHIDESREDGSCDWRSPNGRRYHRPASLVGQPRQVSELQAQRPPP